MKVLSFLLWLCFFVCLIVGITYYGFWDNKELQYRRINIEATETAKDFIEEGFLPCSSLVDSNAVTKYYAVGINTEKTDSVFFRFSKYKTDFFHTDIEKDTFSIKRDFALTIFDLEVLENAKWRKQYFWWNRDSLTMLISYTHDEKPNTKSIQNLFLPVAYDYLNSVDFSCNDLPLKNK